MGRRGRVAVANVSARSSVGAVLRAFLVIVAALGAFGCAGGLYSGHKFAVPGPDEVFLEKSKGVLTVRDRIAVVCAPQNEVKEADVFYLLIFNGSGEFLEFDPSRVRLIDANGRVVKPLGRQQRIAKLGARTTPKPPIGISGDIFRANRAVRDIGDLVSPLNPSELFQAKVMPGARTAFFVYFPPKSAESSRLRLVVPGIRMGQSRKELTFVFTFEVQPR